MAGGPAQGETARRPGMAGGSATLIAAHGSRSPIRRPSRLRAALVSLAEGSKKVQSIRNTRAQPSRLRPEAQESVKTLGGVLRWIPSSMSSSRSALTFNRSSHSPDPLSLLRIPGRQDRGSGSGALACTPATDASGCVWRSRCQHPSPRQQRLATLADGQQWQAPRPLPGRLEDLPTPRPVRPPRTAEARLDNSE